MPVGSVMSRGSLLFTQRRFSLFSVAAEHFPLSLLLCSSTIALGVIILYHMDVLWLLPPSPQLQTGL